ncbi:MAG: multidrug efflux RND transporter permease subunit [Rhodanobacter sp.]
MPGFFIDRPIFAWVVAILISLGGVLAILNLGVQSYPSIAPPEVVVNAKYPGANAETTEKTVTQVIEQQLTGIDNLLYFRSSSSATGYVSITLTFAAGTNPDIAQVQVQNQVSRATPQLPEEIVRQGIKVSKANSSTLMSIALISDNPAIDRDRLNDIVGSTILDQISRVPGVGSAQQFGAEYAMRIWLDPDKLHGYGLSATQVLNAVQAQNVQFAAGALGADPAVPGQGFQTLVSTEGRFTTPGQFGNIILRANADGTTVKLDDVARIAFGPNNYGFDTRYDGKPIGAFSINLLPGANALNVATAVRAKMDELAPSFPQGVTWFSPYDTTTFVKTSVTEVTHTLIEAIILVFLVMLLFLQNFRATIIPTLVIPVALLGTFLGMQVLGFTINQLTLFGMVLAIGIVVDDAIVVIENVERIMTEEGLSPKEATRKSMGQITGAVVAISVVLAAVFIPSALQPGASGIIYKQFALTIAMSMGFSAFLALSFTPALCASFLQPVHENKKNIVYRKFNSGFASMTRSYVNHVGHAVHHAPRWMAAFVLISALGGFLFTQLPGSFLPEEDQGYAMISVQLPPGATKQRTIGVMSQIRKVLHDDGAVAGVFQIVGFSFMGSGENTGMMWIHLKDYADRDVTAAQFIERANRELSQIRDAKLVVMNVPTVQGLGQFGGFDMYLQDRGGAGRDAMAKALATLVAKANKDKALSQVRQNGLDDAPQLNLDVDRTQAQSMGLSVSDVYNALALMLAPAYINDFNYGGRVKRVMMQADAPYRMGPEALQRFYTPSATATAADGTPAMIPLSNVVHATWHMATPSLNRYNGFSAIEVVGSPAPGYASGDAMDQMEKLVNADLPHGFAFDWTGQSYEQVLSGNTATLLMVLSLFIVFLALAALYESWSIPVSVMLIVPLAFLGAVIFALVRGLPNDVFFKIGLITVIGLAAKNAILIVEFAVAEQKAGRSLREATVDAARLRLRPILMTSMAFILGVFPLFISTGAGANARHAIGTGVIGGMTFATFLGVLLIPVFYIVVRRLLGDKLDDEPPATNAKPPGDLLTFDSDPRRGR